MKAVQELTTGARNDNRTKYRGFLHLAGIGALNYLVGLAAMNLLTYPQHIPVIWLPGGIALATLLNSQKTRWPGIFSVMAGTNLLAFLSTGLSAGTSLGLAFAYGIEMLLAAWMIERIFNRQRRSLQIKQMALAIVLGFPCFALSAMLGAAVAYLSYAAPVQETWLSWILSSGLGVFLIVPLAVSYDWEKIDFHQLNRQLFLEGLFFLLLLALTSMLIFLSRPSASGVQISMPYLTYPLIFWAAIRLGSLGAASATSLLVIFALWGAIDGLGPLSAVVATFEGRIFATQVYLVISTIFAWIVIAIINERHLVELALQASEKSLRSILDQAPVFIGQIDARGKLVFHNWTPSTASGEFQLFAGLSPDHAAWLMAGVQNCLHSGKPWQAELAAEDNGVKAWYEVQLSPILGGGKVESIILTASEITQSKQAAEALRTSEERFSVAVRGANDGIWDWDIVTNRIYYSSRWKKMLGYSEDDIHDSPDEWLGRVHPDDIDQLRDDLRAHIGGYSPHFINEHRILHKGSSYRWVLARGMAVRSEGKTAHRLAGSLTDITARKSTEERLMHDAMHDLLTGLPNRVYFLDQLKRSIQRLKRHGDYQLAVLFIDLDRFKLVNESFGHNAGDEMLVGIAHRLENSVRPQDTVARFGGDEFAILLDDIKAEDDAIRVADRIQIALTIPFILQGQEVFSSASIGIVVNTGNYERAEDLLRDADAALYQAKANGRARHLMFDDNMRGRSLALLQLETDLRRAIEREEFEVYYQPVVSLANGKITSFEALVRWHHPERGMTLPTDFIPTAEDNGLVVAINDWVLRSACLQLKKWLAINPYLRIAVNLSARQLQNRDLAAQVKQLLDEIGLEGHSLQLEVTESAAMQDFDLTIKILESLTAMGIQISLDDFGMQYSSLDYLKRFPVTTIKIDRSFVWNLPDDGEDSAITRTIISVGHLLNKVVVAEGVESSRQLEFLIQHQCDSVQGYLFSEPQAADAITAMLESGVPLSPSIGGVDEDLTENL